jgi:hypothetical protein
MLGTLTGNKLIDGLSAPDIERLKPHLEAAPLVQKQTINAPGAPIEQVYFPTSGAVSMVASLDDGVAVEVGLIGLEGMVGTPVLLGSKTASNEAFVQLNGAALRMPTGALLDEVEQSRTCGSGCCATRRLFRFRSGRARRATPGTLSRSGVRAGCWPRMTAPKTTSWG